MPYTPILATLGYVFSPDGSRVLLTRRDKRPTDLHLLKWNGLGGKLEANEDIVSGMRREIREEAGIECTALHTAGTISWPGFGRQGEDWFGFLFRITAFTGTPYLENEEGTLHWIPRDEVLSLNLWPGDRYFLPMILGGERRQFHGVMPYRNGEPISWHVSFIDIWTGVLPT